MQPPGPIQQPARPPHWGRGNPQHTPHQEFGGLGLEETVRFNFAGVLSMAPRLKVVLEKTCSLEENVEFLFNNSGALLG